MDKEQARGTNTGPDPVGRSPSPSGSRLLPGSPASHLQIITCLLVKETGPHLQLCGPTLRGTGGTGGTGGTARPLNAPLFGIPASISKLRSFPTLLLCGIQRPHFQ